MSGETSRRGPAPSPAVRAFGAGTPVLTQCPSNDDERERRQRRRSRVTDLALGASDSPLRIASPRLRQVLTVPLQWTNSQISEHYTTCIKLSSENKITTKNAFGLHLIDYMNDVLQQKNADMANFKVAAGTLDAGVKIYSVRVDAVHTDIYKVLGGLGKDKDKDSAPTNDGDSPEQDDSPVLGTTKKKVQAKRKHTFKTIEQNLNNINVPEAGHRCAVDPMFQKTIASFDECSITGIFLSGLRTRSYSSELCFDFQIIPLPSSEALTLPNAEAMSTMNFKSLLAQCAEQRLICSSLAGFQFSKWDAESDESVSALLDKYKRSEQAFDVDTEAESDAEDSAPTPPAGDFASDSPRNTPAEKIGEFRDHLSCFTMSQQSQRTDSNPFGDGDITTMSLHLSMNPGEYSYFSPRILSMWAGPNHWHFKPAHKADASGKEPRRRNTKKVFEIDFDEVIDFKAHFHKARAALTVSKSIVDGQNVKSMTLPADYSYDPNNITQLFLKPSVKYCRTSKPQSLLSHDDKIGDYDYNNPNDTSNFCPALKIAESNDDDDDDDDSLPSMGLAGEFNLTSQHGREDLEFSRVNASTYGMHLLAEPQKVQKIAIQYAKTAKKMDMRRLKENMWRLLVGQQQAAETAAEVEDAVDAVQETLVVVEEKVFSNIMKELHHRLPPVMVTNLSVPLALACLLHLANEKNLKLENTEDLSNILVKQDN